MPRFQFSFRTLVSVVLLFLDVALFLFGGDSWLKNVFSVAMFVLLVEKEKKRQKEEAAKNSDPTQ